MLTTSSITSKEGTREKKARRNTKIAEEHRLDSFWLLSLIQYTGPPQARISKRMSTLKELDQKAD